MKARIYKSRRAGSLLRSGGYWRSWNVDCPGGHGDCSGYSEGARTWAAALRKLIVHQQLYTVSEGRCDHCGQTRMLFPHKQVHSWTPEDHDCQSCTCDLDEVVEIKYRRLCTSCFQIVPLVLNETEGEGE